MKGLAGFAVFVALVLIAGQQVLRWSKALVPIAKTEQVPIASEISDPRNPSVTL
jgi:hypothetical protein